MICNNPKKETYILDEKTLKNYFDFLELNFLVIIDLI